MSKSRLFENKRSKRSIAEKFGAHISVLIFVIVVFSTIYAVLTGIGIVDRAIKDKALTIVAFSNVIVEENLPDLVERNYTTFNQKMYSLLSRNVFVFAYVIDQEGFVHYSTYKTLQGKTIDYRFPEKSEDYKRLLDNLSIPLIINSFTLPNNDRLVLASYKYDPANENRVYYGNLVLAFIFIVFGFVSARILAKMVTQPLENLYIGANKISQGDFDYRIEVKEDDEIGKLASQFNVMAKKLEESYTDLEHKVEQRTKELAQKNDELQTAYKDLQAAQVKLVHSEKMSSLGQLVAGVAHELNNPINFIYGNIEHLKTYVSDMKELIEKFITFEERLSDDEKSEINDIKEDIDYEFLIDDIDDLLESCKEGAERTRQIVLDLRNFSRLDEANVKEVNIHEGIDSTLNILHNKYKNRINIVKEYDETLPLVTCLAGQINQVFMNILANAAQAIEKEGTVTIKTEHDGNNACIYIIDNGKGISKENISKIFDPFFTTKDVGEGTGLGLSVTYGIIQNHNGSISIDSEVGKGTTFKVCIPIKWQGDNSKEKSSLTV